MAIGFVAERGNPVTWADDRAAEFCEGEADLSGSSSRLTLNAGSNRCEIWRVAMDVSGDDPIFGEGGGGFQFRYNQERDDPNQLARDAHCVELEMLSELGVVGLVLFLAAMAGAPSRVRSAPGSWDRRRRSSRAVRWPPARTGSSTRRSTGSGPIRR